jgi:hypothetical protein
MTTSTLLSGKPRSGYTMPRNKSTQPLLPLSSLPICLATAAFKNACSLVLRGKQKMGAGERCPSTISFQPREQQNQLRKAFAMPSGHSFSETFVASLDETNRVKHIKKKVAAKKLTIRQVDGAGEKTDFYPLRALNEEEASIQGTIRVVQCLDPRYSGFHTEVASSTLRFFVGDWLTIRNLRLMKYIRMTEPEAWGRMDWVQEAAMPFHFQLNAVYMLIRTHLGESDSDASCLDRHRVRSAALQVGQKEARISPGTGACGALAHCPFA